MLYDQEAIYHAYPDMELTIIDGQGCFEKDGNTFKYDEEKVKKAREELNKLKYQTDRLFEPDGYPSLGSQLDYIYHNGIDKWKTDMIDPVKAKYPKPE
tara:strand:- start:378 stop:671 length:294 start_codon:yes stop_codon:yes gene_type:complete